MKDRTAPIAKITRPVAAGIFARKRLFGLLDRGRRNPIIWVSGPPGSGKTSLVSSYLDARRLPCFWYRIDEGDADPATFFYYVGIGGRKAAPRHRKPLPLFAPEYSQGIHIFTLRYFENLFSRFNGPYIIVFDNYHSVPAESTFHDVISDGLTTIPDGINVIVISRHGLPPVLSRLHAKGLMRMLGWDDLRLTLEETTGIVRLRGQGIRSSEVAGKLHLAADGWVTGLVLMLEGVKRGAEPQSFERIAPEEIAHYFGSELFDKADDETQQFLLKTAFLPKMTVRIADELTGLFNAKGVLSSLSRNNYFTEKHIDAEPTYEYHPLFREFLLSRAKKTYPPATLSALLYRAALLLEDAGQTEAAMLLHRSIGEWNAMGQLILKHAPSMLAQGRIRPLKEWIDSLPKRILEENAWLLYWRGVCLLGFDPSQARSCFEKAFERFKGDGDESGIFLSWSGVADSITYGLDDFRGFDRWISELEELMQTSKTFASPFIEGQVSSTMVAALAFRQPWHPSIDSWAQRVLALPEDSATVGFKIKTLYGLIYCHLDMGDYEKAGLEIRSLRRLRQSQYASTVSQVTGLLAEVAYDQFTGSHDKCLKTLSEALALSRTTGVHIGEHLLLAHGISSALNVNEYNTAKRWLEEMLSNLGNCRLWEKALYHFLQARYALVQEDLSEANFHADLALRLSTEAGSPGPIGGCHLMKASVMHELGKPRQAEEHLGQVFSIIQRIGSKCLKFPALMLEAQFAFDQGKEDLGRMSLRRALTFGKGQGYLNTFFDLPAVTAKLCVKALEAGIEVEYVQDIVRKRNLIPKTPPLHVDNWPWSLKIVALGGFELVRDGRSVSLFRKAQNKPLSMLKALIAFGGKEVPEERITNVIWPDGDGDTAHQSFDTNLHRLRRLIGNPEALRFHDGRLTLNRDHCWVDVLAFEGLIEEADAEQKEGAENRAGQLIGKAIAMYRGPFLSMETDQPWMVPMRERLRSKFLRSVRRLGHWLEEAELWEKALLCYQRGLEVDDLAEELYRRLMSCHLRLNQEAEAVSVYNRCKRVFSAVLGIEPSAETHALYTRVMSNLKNCG